MPPERIRYDVHGDAPLRAVEALRIERSLSAPSLEALGKELVELPEHADGVDERDELDRPD